MHITHCTYIYAYMHTEHCYQLHSVLKCNPVHMQLLDRKPRGFVQMSSVQLSCSLQSRGGRPGGVHCTQLHCTAATIPAAAAATISLSLALTVISPCTALSCNWMCNCSSDSGWSEWSGQDNQTPLITVTEMQLSKNVLGKLHFGKVHFEKVHIGKVHFEKFHFGQYTLEKFTLDNTLWKSSLWTIHFGTIDFTKIQFSGSYTLGQSDSADNSNATTAPNLCQNFSKEADVQTI